MKTILLAGLLALAALSAIAHGGRQTTSPENGSVLAEAPPKIVMTFAKRVRLTRVRMIRDEGDAIDLALEGQTSFATRFVIPLTGNRSGLYRIEWRGLAGDGHIIRGVFSFRVE